jgi:nucleotide-binding universal stress UspA family protein
MTEVEMSPKTLVPVDGTELAEQVIYRVEADVLSSPGEAEIIIAYVRVPESDDSGRAKMTGRLVQQTLVAKARGLRCRLEQVDAATIPEGICEIARREHVDLIAMYTDSARPLGERPQGSYSKTVAENTDCEVRVLEASLKLVQD